MYRVELSLQNYPIKHIKNASAEKENQIKKLKAAIVTDASLVLNSKTPRTLINHINKINYHVNNLCDVLGISAQQVAQKRASKALKVGGFNNGYVLNQTTLKDNVIDENTEFNPLNCNEIYFIERDNNKYFEWLQNFEKKHTRMILRFSMPIAINRWGILFDNPKIEQMLNNIQSLYFNIQKNTSGRLLLTVNGQTSPGMQLSFFDIFDI